MDDSIVGWLAGLGAADISHPGGSLLEHLVRTGELLESWKVAAHVEVAGLCHALYGTDGFPTALVEMGAGSAVADRIGTQAEELAYLYGCCVRSEFWAQVGRAETPPVVDRFTGDVVELDAGQVAALMQITLANELDVMLANPQWAALDGPGIVAMLERCADMLPTAGLDRLREVIANG